MNPSVRVIVISCSLLALACGSASKPPVRAALTGGPAATAISAPLDEKSIAMATAAPTIEKAPDGVVKVSFPRKDVEVAVDGYRMAPFLGLTSWVAFTPGKAGVAEAMIMGDLVLFEDEVNPVMSALLEGGAEVTALHNHFFYDAPKVFFMHVGGEGTVAGLGKAVRAAIEATAEIRKRAPRPAATFGGGTPAEPSTLQAAKLDAILGVKGTAKDGMYKMTVGRSARAACDCSIGKSMGVNTWAAFAGNEELALVDGDFAVTERELQPVLKALRSGGVNVVAIHHHMTGESPRILFLHYWGKGRAADLATVVRRALELTEADRQR